MALINKLTAIADAIRAKTGKEDTLTLDQMPLEIAGIQTGVELNFKVVGGTTEPTSSSENTIWVNTDVEITSWVFSATEPGSSDVMALSIISGSPWYLSAPQSLSAGDVLNFEIPENVSHTYEAINIADPTTGDEYFVRNSDGSACNAWVKGTKVSVVLSNDTNKLNGYGGNAKTAYIRNYGSYGITEGMVWIATGTTSTVEFNALKKNGIVVYPLSAKQYVSGAWVDKAAKSYQNGAWVDWWNGELYDAGNEYETFTGGWTATALSSTTQVTKDITSMTIKTDYGDDALHCSNKMDLTDFSKLVVTGKSFRNNSSAQRKAGNTKICIWSAIGSSLTNGRVAYADYPAEDYDGEFELDVSSLTGEYYVGVFAGRYYSVTVRKAKLS